MAYNKYHILLCDINVQKIYKIKIKIKIKTSMWSGDNGSVIAQ